MVQWYGPQAGAVHAREEQMNRAGIPARHCFVFWDVKPRTLDVEKHSAFIMARVLEYGDMAAVKWLHGRYGKRRIARFFQTRYARRLSPKTIEFWRVVLRSGEKGCRKTSSLATRDPFWRR
jgi:hypothetical protein